MAQVCYYELLGVTSDASDSDLKKAYRKKALEWHPDKNYYRVEEATDMFAKIQGAYEILSDPQERAWYDDHRDAILRGDTFDPSQPDAMASGPTSDSLMKYFSPTLFHGFDNSSQGFFHVYGNIFRILAEEEVRAGSQILSHNDLEFLEGFDFGLASLRADEPRTRKGFGGPRFTLLDFYTFWLAFSTRRTFAWHDQYHVNSSQIRQLRRVMEKENKRARERAKKEFNDTVRSLTSYVRKLDPRIKAWKKEQYELQQERQEKRKLRQASHKARAKTSSSNYTEPEWAKVYYDELLGDLNDLDLVDDQAEASNAPETTHPANRGEALDATTLDSTDEGGLAPEQADDMYCVVCDKQFKSKHHWNNHKNSREHSKAVERMRAEMEAEDALFKETPPPEPTVLPSLFGKSKRKKKKAKNVLSATGEEIFVADVVDFMHPPETDMAKSAADELSVTSDTAAAKQSKKKLRKQKASSNEVSLVV
ncbi:hypothetical protein IWQ61_002364 [Dispira simplex]|nr:hypothetical protein IWQ61_002364 [Dispira simplex]